MRTYRIEAEYDNKWPLNIFIQHVGGSMGGRERESEN